VTKQVYRNTDKRKPVNTGHTVHKMRKKMPTVGGSEVPYGNKWRTKKKK
jgi:hypothetical protein